MTLIYKLVDAAEWRLFVQDGVFHGSAIDRADGYIHFSFGDQLQETAAKHFRNRGDLVLFACDPAALGDALRNEVSRGGALFPHLYADLRMDSVLWSRPVALDRDGVPRIELNASAAP